MNEYQGWLNIYKPLGQSSFSVVNQIKKKFNISKIGHGGTLDPLAEGVLPIAIGKATKLIPFINSDNKEYEFEVKWGQQTSTDDSEGSVIATSDYIPSILEINNKLQNISGEIIQKPPKASAVKINGKRAYSLFRSNKKFEMHPKKVFVHSVQLLESSDIHLTRIRINCGKGFYIRSFARDLGESLNSKAHIYSLKRTKVGKFHYKNANLLDDLLKIGQRLTEFKDFHTSASMLDDILAYEIVDEDSKVSISRGKSINIDVNRFKNPSLNLTEEKIIFLTDKEKIISFGRLSGNLFKPNKVLI